MINLGISIQDLVFTRVFAMIVVRGGADGDWAKELDDAKKNENVNTSNSNNSNNNKNNSYSNKQFPFECHAFVCDSRQVRRMGLLLNL